MDVALDLLIAQGKSGDIDGAQETYRTALEIAEPLSGQYRMEALKQIKSRFDLPVIMISGHGSIETAVEATKNGAYDFIEKPLSYDKVVLSINKGLQFDRLTRENLLLREKGQGIARITGESQAIGLLREDIVRVAPTGASV